MDFQNVIFIPKNFQTLAGELSTHLIHNNNPLLQNRKCKKIKEQIDEIEKKKKQEKEKSNPENRLREIFGENVHSAADENKVKKNPNAPMATWGDQTTFNMNELLRNNIKTSPYFSEILPLRTVQEVQNFL